MLERVINTGNISYQLVPGSVIIITGYTMFQLMKSLQATGVSRQNILYLNFFNEIQVVLGWEPFVDRLMRTGNVKST
jgi:predicted AAA+ superfamily ATPase